MTSPNDHRNDNRAQSMVKDIAYFVANYEPEEVAYCARFGCGKVLTMTEQLYGSLCHEHSVQHKQDITKHINY